MTAISNFKKAAQMMRRRQKQHRINKMLLTCGINSVSIYRSHMETKAKLTRYLYIVLTWRQKLN